MSKYLDIALDFIKRHIILVGILIGVYVLLKVNSAIIDTLLILVAAETIAILFSGVAHYSFTKMKFTEESPIVLGYIFLGVHLLIGLALIGVYITQMGADPALIPAQHIGTSSTMTMP